MQRNNARLKVGAMTMAVLATCVLAVGSAAAEVVITVDNSKPRQVMEGFGATTFSLVHSGPLGDTLTPDLRQRAIEACYGQVKLNLGNLEVGFVRRHPAAPTTEPMLLSSRANQRCPNTNPSTSSWSQMMKSLGFQKCRNFEIAISEGPVLFGLTLRIRQTASRTIRQSPDPNSERRRCPRLRSREFSHTKTASASSTRPARNSFHFRSPV